MQKIVLGWKREGGGDGTCVAGSLKPSTIPWAPLSHAACMPTSCTGTSCKISRRPSHSLRKPMVVMESSKCKPATSLDSCRSMLQNESRSTSGEALSKRRGPQYSGVRASSAARCMAPDSRKPCIAARNLWRSTDLALDDGLYLGRTLAGGGGDRSDLPSCCEADAAPEAEGAGGGGSTEPPPSRSLERRQRTKMTRARGKCHQFMAASTLPPVATSAWAACSAEKPALVSSCVSWLWLWSIRSIETSASAQIQLQFEKQSCCRSGVQQMATVRSISS